MIPQFWGGLLTVLVVILITNAINLIDGIDGLASGLSSVSLVVLGALFLEREMWSCSLIAFSSFGVLVPFFYYNVFGNAEKHSKIFMGDTGSLALGALLGTIAVMTKHEILLALVGGVFVMETVSVMIQVAYFKKTGGKRFFKMAPLHHHFEQLGWPETTVVIRFWIIAFILAVIGLSSLLSL